MSDLRALHEAATRTVVRSVGLSGHECVAMWKVVRRLGRSRDEDVLLNALYHDHADARAGFYASGELIEREKVARLVNRATALYEAIADDEYPSVINFLADELAAALADLEADHE